MAHFANLGLVAGLAAVLAAAGCDKIHSEGQRHAITTAPGCQLSDAAKQGFTGFAGSDAKLVVIGRIKNGTTDFRLYRHEYINPQSEHANRRLVVFSNTCQYLGSYLVDEPPLGIEGQSLVFRDTGTPGNRVNFTGSKPPGSIWIDGSLSNLEP